MNVTGATRILGLQHQPLTDRALAGAWRRFAREHHPDMHPGAAGAVEDFIAGQEAHEVLLRRIRLEREAGWQPAAQPLRGVVRGARAAAATPYRFTAVDSREWRA